MTAAVVWSTVFSIMVATTPICFQSHDWIGDSSSRTSWATFVYMQSSKGAPGSLYSLGILYMQVTGCTDAGATSSNIAAHSLNCIDPACKVSDNLHGLTDRLCNDFFIGVWASWTTLSNFSKEITLLHNISVGTGARGHKIYKLIMHILYPCRLSVTDFVWQSQIFFRPVRQNPDRKPGYWAT